MIMGFIKKLTGICLCFFIISLALSACTSNFIVHETSDVEDDDLKTVSTLIKSGDINANRDLLLSALQRLNVAIEETSADQYEFTTLWIDFANDPKTQSINLNKTIKWTSQGTRERHRFQLRLEPDPSSGGVFLSVLDVQRQLKIDLSDSEVTYLQWHDYPTLRSVAITFLEFVQQGIKAAAHTEVKMTETKHEKTSKASSVIALKGSQLYYAAVNKETLWQAVSKVLNEKDIPFSVFDDSQKTIATKWTALDWDAGKQQLTQKTDKKANWAFNISGKGPQQHRFNIEIHQGMDNGTIIDVYHKGWREQVDLTPDASITTLEWQEQPTEEQVAEAFLKLLSLELSNYLE